VAERSKVQHAGTDRRYLRVEDLHRLRHLSFFTRRPVEGRYAGRHASPLHGHAVEFSDYRQYTPGDEISTIDWKVFGRSDKLFIKLFEQQTDLTVNLLVDASASMAYRGINEPTAGSSWLEQPTKFDHACLMAAAIAFLITQQRDGVAFALTRNGLRDYLPPCATPAHVRNMTQTMARTELAGKAQLAEALEALAQRTRRRGLLIVFSDLLEDQEPILQALSNFNHRGNEVIIFHTLHPEELHLPALDEAIFIDSESAQRLKLNLDDVSPAYHKRLKQFLDSWRQTLRARGIDYNLVSTGTPYHQALANCLNRRNQCD
jgi:uncharacterized protein (DUF58 family)